MSAELKRLCCLIQTFPCKTRKTPPSRGQNEVFPLRVLGKNRPLQMDIFGLFFTRYGGRGRHLLSELSGKKLNRASREHRTWSCALHQSPFCEGITLHSGVPFQMVLREVGPNRRVGPKVLQTLALKRTHFTDRGDIRATETGRRTRERKADVTDRNGRAPRVFECLGKKLGERRFAIGSGDREHGAAPKQPAEVQLAQTYTTHRPRSREPGMRGNKTGTENDELVLARFGQAEIFRCSTGFIVNYAVRADSF